MASLCAARAPVATRPSTRHQPVRSVAVRAAASPQKVRTYSRQPTSRRPNLSIRCHSALPGPLSRAWHGRLALCNASKTSGHVSRPLRLSRALTYRHCVRQLASLTLHCCLSFDSHSAVHAAVLQDQKPVATSKVAQWTAAGLAAAYLAAMPAFAAESPPSGLKQKICANNPTAKICLRGSYQRTFDSK